MAKSKKSRGSKRKTSLPAFFRKLWSRPDLLERFSRSPKGRAEVLREFSLSARHQTILAAGCMRDILRELAGIKGVAENTYIIGAADDVKCRHPECQAFMKAIKKR